MLLSEGVNQNGYGPPTGFCFDELCKDTPIMDDERLEDYNVDERVKTFIDDAYEQVGSKLNAVNRIYIGTCTGSILTK